MCDHQSRGWEGGGAEYLPRGDTLPADIQPGMGGAAQQSVESGRRVGRWVEYTAYTVRGPSGCQKNILNQKFRKLSP